MDWNLFIAPLTLIVVELLKRAGVPTRWLPLVACLIGALLGLGFAAYYGQDWLSHVVWGLIAGAAASGIYDAGKSATKPADVIE